jgi:hypothetical protein
LRRLCRRARQTPCAAEEGKDLGGGWQQQWLSSGYGANKRRALAERGRSQPARQGSAWGAQALQALKQKMLCSQYLRGLGGCYSCDTRKKCLYLPYALFQAPSMHIYL